MIYRIKNITGSGAQSLLSNGLRCILYIFFHNSIFVEAHFLLTHSSYETYRKDKQYTQLLSDILWEKWCWAPLRVVEHIEGLELKTHRFLSFWPYPLSKTIQPCFHSLWPLNYRCSSLRSTECVGTLFFLKDSTTHCGLEKKWKEEGVSFIMIRTAALTSTMWRHRCYMRTFFSTMLVNNVRRSSGEGVWFRVCFDYLYGEWSCQWKGRNGCNFRHFMKSQ